VHLWKIDNVVDSIAQNALIRLIKLIPGGAREIYRKASIKEIKKVVSYNQVRLADYTFNASQKHRRLAEELEKVSSAGQQNLPQRLAELNNALDDLSEYLEDTFREIAHKNFDFLLTFFKYKTLNNKEPRICIKAVQDNTIVTLVRNKFSYQEEDFGIEENTAFVKVNETGRYYLCADIPKEILRGTYRNARIIDFDVQNYYRLRQPSLFTNLKYRFSRATDEEWRRCWRSVVGANNQTIRPPIDTCYKSTLVVPLSLINTDTWLSNEFRNHFKIGSSAHSANFGFLCLDHQNKSFFDEDEDVDLGYTFANILSLHLIVRLNYTTYSSVFNQSMKIIKQTNATNAN
jgi:hypothetical protein